jgi:RNA 3'-terminal phosphate cyclase
MFLKLYSYFSVLFQLGNLIILKFTRGFYPKGGGEVDLTVEPVKHLSCVTLDQPQTIKCVNGVSFVAGTIPIRVKDDKWEINVSIPFFYFFSAGR